MLCKMDLLIRALNGGIYFNNVDVNNTINIYICWGFTCSTRDNKPFTCNFRFILYHSFTLPLFMDEDTEWQEFPNLPKAAPLVGSRAEIGRRCGPIPAPILFLFAQRLAEKRQKTHFEVERRVDGSHCHKSTLKCRPKVPSKCVNRKSFLWLKDAGCVVVKLKNSNLQHACGISSVPGSECICYLFLPTNEEGKFFYFPHFIDNITRFREV